MEAHSLRSPLMILIWFDLPASAFAEADAGFLVTARIVKERDP